MEVLHTILINNANISAWIGAFDLHSDDNIVFLGNGQPVANALWDVFQPNHGHGNCVMMDGTSGKLAMEDCTSGYLGMFCETDPTVSSSRKQFKSYLSCHSYL